MRRSDAPGRASTIIGFPNPANEKAARVVAGGVLLLSSLTVVLSLTIGGAWLWLTVLIWLGFLARVLTGPKLSVLGQLATRVAAPRLGPPKLVPGPPKRFAQGIGAAVTTAAVAALVLGQPGATRSLLGVLVLAAGLESIFAFCVGCAIFAGLMRLGLIPAATCEACTNWSGGAGGRQVVVAVGVRGGQVDLGPRDSLPAVIAQPGGAAESHVEQ